MKILVAAFITALLVFTLATAWIEVVQPRLDVLAGASFSKSHSPLAGSAAARGKRRAMDGDSSDEDVTAGDVDDKPNSAAIRKARRAEAVRQQAEKERIRQDFERIKAQDQKLAAREETLRLLFDDIRMEKAAVDEIRRRSSDEFAFAQRRGSETTVGRSAVESVSAEVTNESMSSAPAKVKLDGENSSERMATVIQKLADKGSISIAATLLSGIKEREAAKVLSTLSNRDPRLASRLSNELQASKGQPVQK